MGCTWTREVYCASSQSTRSEQTSRMHGYTTKILQGCSCTAVDNACNDTHSHKSTYQGLPALCKTWRTAHPTLHLHALCAHEITSVEPWIRRRQPLKLADSTTPTEGSAGSTKPVRYARVELTLFPFAQRRHWVNNSGRLGLYRWPVPLDSLLASETARGTWKSN